MGRTAWTFAGAVVGYYFGVPQLGAAVGGAIGGAVEGPTRVQGPTINETGVQTSQEGAPRAIVYGTAHVTGNIIYTSQVFRFYYDVENGGEGKGGGGTVQQQTMLLRTFAIRICEGPIAGVLRVWEDNKLVYDVRPGSGVVGQSQQWAAGTIFYLGTEDQLPDVLSTLVINPDMPAYRGTAYMLRSNADLTDRRGSIPQYRFEVAQSVTENIVELPVVEPRMVELITAGGVFNDYELVPYAMDSPGSCWLVYFDFNSVDVGTTLTLYVKVAGGVVWSRAIVLPPHFANRNIYMVQINHVPDGSTITGGFEGHYEGQFAINTRGLTEDYMARGDGGPVYESDNPNFGVLVNSDGDLASAGHDLAFTSPYVWGPEFLEEGLTGDTISLSEIVADIHARCRIPADKFDVTELDDAVTGLVLAGDYSGADAINTLRVPYFFDKCEHDKKLHYVKRGAAVAYTVTVDDLVEEPDDSMRNQASEYAKKLHLFYQHANSGYAAVKATSARSSPDARVTGEATISVPVVLSEDQAAQTAAKLHKLSWTEAEGEITIALPESFLWLTPSDVLGVNLHGRVNRTRVESMNYAAGVIQLTLKHDRQSAYTSELTGVPVAPPSLPPSNIVGATTFAVLDISARSDSEDDLHYLVAGTGAEPGWPGWQYQRSLDAGANYTAVANYTRAPVMGVLVDAVPTAAECFTDTTNTVRIQLYRDGQSIDSITDAQFLSEGGAFVLVDAAGVCEVLQYLDADDEGDGVFALTTLHRGQLNSGARAHASGETFVMFRDASHVDAQSAWIGQILTSRGVSLGAAAETGAVKTLAYAGMSQVEWSVDFLTLARDGSDVITGSFIPRYRFGSDANPLNSVNARGYRITLDDGVLPAVVLSDQATTTFTYDASALGAPLTVSVQPINRITGAGPATSGSI
ncbi:phage tail protein [Variovorax rhizosphaerae]|uniref:Phage tail protein n=1 Tax=Variovorax rhizosphaerae TaxID=1836200 RepID=A0ABU8WFU0_9BURK